MRFGAALCVIFLWTGAAWATPLRDAEPLAEIPFRIDYQGWITVDVMVNGNGPYEFIVDTGATITTVFENLNAIEGFGYADREPIRIFGLTSEQRLPARSIGDIDVGPRRLSGLVSVVLKDWTGPMRTPRGILGLDFLAQYSVSVDPDARLLRLYDPAIAPARATRNWSSASLNRDEFGQNAGALYRVRTSMHGRDIPCIVDLGASGTVLNYSALRLLLSGFYVNESWKTGFGTGSRLHDIFDNTAKARLVEVKRVTIGRARWRDQTFIVHDAQIFGELGVMKTPYCLIGADLLVQRSFIFDFERERLYLGPKTNQSSTRG